MILLASRSPQRQYLLRQAGLRFLTIDTLDDAAAAGSGVAQAIAIERARAKALAAQWQDHRAAFSQPHAVILAADTVVAHGNQALGSPTTPEEARDMLQRLSGSRHTVMTAHCCYRPALDGAEPVEAVAVALAQVTMLPLSPQQIDDYVASGEGIGKAGGYAIQGDADPFVADISGERDTVIGLQVGVVRRLYRQVTGQQPEEM